MFDIPGALARLIIGYMTLNKGAKVADDWFRLGVSILATALTSFAGTWGATTWALYDARGAVGALVLGFASGLLAMAAMTLALWMRSPLTKGIPLMVPKVVGDKATETDSVYTERR